MLPRILTQKYIDHGMISEEEREVYEYGFDITIYTIWSTTALLLLGLLLKQFIATIILVLGFYTFQTTGGGYHAKTHLRCFLTMVVGLLVGLSAAFIQDHHILLWSLLVIGALLLFLVPLVLHPNKSYLETEGKRLTIKSIAVTLSLLVSVVVLNIFWSRMLYAFAAVFLLAGVSRITGKIVYNRNTKA